MKDEQKLQLMAHQSQAIAWALDRHYFGLFMEMRLGKTISYIRWVQLQPSIRRILVIAPIDALRSWKKELVREGEICYPAYLEQGADARLNMTHYPFEPYELCRDREWVLLNYDGLRSLESKDQLYVCGERVLGPAWWKWDAVVLDESTKIKNPQAKITQLCTTAFRHVPHRAILSGLPNPESELDFCCQFLFTHGNFMNCKTYWHFRSKFFQPDWSGNWVLKKGVYNDLHHAVHELAFIRRRSEVRIGPKKIYEQRYATLSDAEYKIYREAERDFAVGVENEQLETQWMIVLQTWLARLAGGFYPLPRKSDADDTWQPGKVKPKPFHTRKLAILEDLLLGELYKEPVVVWFRFNDELRMVEDFLKTKGVAVETMLGETPYKERENINRRFNNKQTRVLLCQIKCAKMGVDFSVADTAIYYSNAYSLEDRSQSEDRIIHPKKDTPQLIIDIVTERTVDEDVVSALADKSFNSQMFLKNIRKRVGL